MDDKRDKLNTRSGDTPSAYSDAYYREAPETRRTCYGYSPAQCYARASEEPEPPETGKRKRSGAGVIAVAAALVVLVLAAALFSGGPFLSFRADAVSEEPPASRELYEVYTAVEEADPEESLGLTVCGTEGLEELSAVEIYTLACRSTVGVTIPGYAYNIFGQKGPSTVTGSGIVLSEDGYILTNFHVIEDAYEKGAPVRVITYDGLEYDAETVGVEIDSDLAVLRIEAEGLAPAELGDSSCLRVGQTIYAVGNPLGELTYTMTSGIVSALDRRITTDVNVTVNMFQIDAAVNNGNSGGPVYNAYGQVVGMVTAKFSLNGMEGLGFAIPISDAADAARDLVEKGYVSGKACMGLKLASVSPSVARYYDMVQGVYIYSVEEGSCSQEAGLQVGDIITAIDGAPVTTSADLVRAVKEYRAGDSAELTVCRDNVYLTVTVVFDEELPAEPMTEAEVILRASGDMDVSTG